MTSILALDLSLNATGWAHTDGRSGVLNPPKTHARGMPRLWWIRGQVLELAEHADVVAIEGYAFGAKGSAVYDIAELGGVIRFELFQSDRRYVEIAPSALKLFATGKGNAPKLEVFAAAIKQLDYQGTSHDEADALWLLAMARAHYWGVTLPEKKRAAVAKVQWPVLTPAPAAVAV